MKTTVIVLAIAALALHLHPTAAGAQTYPDPTTGSGIRGTSAVVTPPPVSTPAAAVRPWALAWPGGMLGIVPSSWFAGLTVASYERGWGDNGATQRLATPRRRRIVAASR